MVSTSVGVFGCNISLPPEFPQTFTDNAGNLVHANAPLKMLPNARHASEVPRFKDFVNEHCSHLVITFANAIKPGSEDLERHVRLLHFLSQIKTPVVAFGLGAQAKSYDDLNLPLSASIIKLLRVLADKNAVVGVRGEFTEQVIRKHTGISNLFVTGCPSLFSGLEKQPEIRSFVPAGKRSAFAGTRLPSGEEQHLMALAIRSSTYHIEPYNKAIDAFHHAVACGRHEDTKLPYFLTRLVNAGAVKRDQVIEHFARRYFLPRKLEPWLQFLKENVNFSFGTRFHCNMASVLAGVPALWITHDMRTKELAEYFQLPHMELSEAERIAHIDQLIELADYTNFKRNYTSVHERFKKYLELSGLPNNLP